MNTLSPDPQKNTRALALAPVLGLCGVIALLSGCASEPVSHVVSAPPPPAPTVAPGVIMATPAPIVTTQTTQTTQTTPNGTVVTTRTQPVSTTIVTQAPPTVQTEVLSAQPTSAHKWITGYWTWRDNRYQWMNGRWEVPPYTAATWNAPRWESESGGYRFYEGYWN
jgi:hypothetical protein